MLETLKAKLDAFELDFVSYRRIAGTISMFLVLGSWAAFFIVGPNWGLDFTGGTEIHLRFEDPVEIGEIREALTELGLGNDAVQSAGGADSYEFKIRIQDPEFGMEDLVGDVREKLVTSFGEEWLQDIEVSAEVGARFTITHTSEEEVPPRVVEEALDGVEGVRAQSGRDTNVVVVTVPGLSSLVQKRIGQVLDGHSFEVLSIEAVGPKVGAELWSQGVIAILWTLGLVLIYVAFRFDLASAPGAIAALFHDVSITIGLFTLAQLEFNLPMIGALLTIVGYSLNDTIVIYDRIRENRDRYRRKDTASLINVSINETLTRTVATSFTTMLAILMFLIFGGEVIRGFALAMMCGIIFGTYSTVFVASPLILVMENLRPKLAGLIALPELPTIDLDGGEEGEIGYGPPIGEMTETERRRRERAELERANEGPGTAG